MALSLGTGIQIASGLAGVLGGKRSQRKADGYQDAAAEILGLKGRGMREALGAAMSYDPAREDRAALDIAGESVADAWRKGMSRSASRFRNAGGDPSGDTRYGMQLAGEGAAVWNPLRMWAADLAATRTARKVGALAQAVGTGGSVSAEYANLANQERSANGMGGSLGLLAGGLGEWFKKDSSGGSNGGGGGDGAGNTDQTVTRRRDRKKRRERWEEYE